MQITVGSLLGRSFTVLMKNFGVFFVIALIFNIPDALVEHFVVAKMSSPQAANFVSRLSTLLFGGLVTGAVLFGVVESLRGGTADLGRCLGIALNRVVPIFLVGLLYGIGVGVGTLLFIIPGIILACMWYVAIPATVVERTGINESFSRSAQLTKGHRMTLFLTALLFFGVVFAVSFLVLAPMITAGGSAATVTFTMLGLAVTVGLWGNVAVGVAYHDLRVAKEGIDTSELAKVFE